MRIKRSSYLFNLYVVLKQGKVLLNRLLDRIIDLCDMFLLDAYRLPWPAAQNVAQYLARFIGDANWLINAFPRLSVYKLAGADWTIIFVGSVDIRTIAELFFLEEVVPQEIDRVAVSQLSNQTQQWFAEGVDLVICELSRIYPKRPKAPITFTTPSWISHVLDIPESLESLIAGRERKSLRNRINRAQKAGFNYRFSQDEADFDHFHYHMYLPYIAARYGDHAVSNYQDQWKRWFNRGGVVLVNQGEKPVAGVLCYISNGTCFSVEGGVLEANPNLIQQGINILIEWYAMIWAHSKGAKIFDLGPTRAWRSDGVFRYKQTWGARVSRRRSICGTWTFLAQNLPPSLQDNINRLGFISELNGKFYNVIVSGDSTSITRADLEKELSAIKKDKLDGLVIISANSEPIIYDVEAHTS